MNHEARYNAAITAIRAVHADTSVPLLTTKESLQGLQEEAATLLAAVEDDLAGLED